MSDLVIVGGGLASARAIKAYREVGGDGRVTLVSRDRVVPYHRPPLSKKFLRGESEATDTFVEPEQFYRDNDVDLLLETEATALRASEHAVELDGKSLRYDKLLIATGAWPRRLEVPGAELEGLHTLRTLADSAGIREAAQEARHAVVVGAGFIAMEVGASLSQLGLEVTLVHRGKGLFELLRARHAQQFFVELYAQNGVTIVLADEVESFGGRDRIDSVRTKRGEVIQAELVVVGIGVEPVFAWLEGSGLELDNGVVVNERFETNVPGVYAVGDVARFFDPIFARHRRIEHWSTANYQGTEVGKILASAEGGYDTVSTFFSEVFGVSIKVFGELSPSDEIVFRGALEDGKAVAFYLDQGRLAACLLTGQDEETEERLKELIRAHATLVDAEALADSAAPLAGAFA